MNSYAALRPLLGAQRMLAPMFYLAYIVSELRRRKGRTLLTALGLGVGVGLVVTVSALSTGLDRAQEKVLAPLTGVGTDMSVTRPVKEGDRPEERPPALRPRRPGRAGREVHPHRLPAGCAAELPGLERGEGRGDRRRRGGGGQPDAERGDDQGHRAGGRLRTAGARHPAADPGARARSTSTTLSLTGVDETKPELGAVTADQITKGRYLRAGDAREAVLNESYAKRSGLAVGETLTLDGKKFDDRRARELAARRRGLRRLHQARRSCRSSPTARGA